MIPISMSTKVAILPSLKRLNALAPLDEAAARALAAAAERRQILRTGQQLFVEGEPVRHIYLMLDGWAARERQLADGRRALISFLLPGDLIGFCDQERPVTSSSVIALNALTICVAPDTSASPTLGKAYAMSRAIEEAHLLTQIARLARMTAHERTVDFLLELYERLELAGLARDGRYECPVTQQMLGDALGLSTVHINRMIQQMRREDGLDWRGRQIRFANPEALRQAVGRQPVRVSAAA